MKRDNFASRLRHRQRMEQANAGKGMKLPRWLKPYFQFVLPVLILVILIQGLI